MDLTILARLGPALAVAVLVGTVAIPIGRRSAGEVVDELLRAVLVAVLVGRIVWLVVNGVVTEPGTVAATAVLLRAGVETSAGVLAAAWWILDRPSIDPEDRQWRLLAGVPMALAGLTTWHALCQVEGTCGGVATSTFGIQLPGRAGPSFPASYVEAGVLAILFGLAWWWRGRVSRLWWLAAAYALVRVLLGYARPALVAHPTADQLGFALVAVACAWVASRAGVDDDVVQQRLDG